MRQFTYAEPRFGLVLMSVFAGVGLLLVALGVFSVIAYTVSRQTHEIGIRMALGAGRPDVLRMVLRMGFQLLGGGVVLGLFGAFAATRVIANQLWGVSPRDPVTLGGGGRGGRGGGAGGVLVPGAAGDAGGSSGRAAIRVGRRIARSNRADRDGADCTVAEKARGKADAALLRVAPVVADPMSTSSGTFSVADAIPSRASPWRDTTSTSSGGHSNTSSSWTWSSIARLLLRRSERGVDPDHRELDQIGGGALQRGVDGGALGEAAGVRIAAVDVGDGTLAAEHRLRHAGFANFRDGRVEQAAHARIAREVVLDVLARLRARDTQLRGEAEGADAVDDAEIHRLGVAARIGRDHQRRHAHHLGGGAGVDVLAVAEGFEQQRVARTCGPAGAARSANSRRPAVSSRRAARKRRGSRGRARCGSECSAGSDWTRTAGRWRRRSG